MSTEDTTEVVKYLDKSQGQSFLPAIPNIAGSRVNYLEDRISNQERTTAVLLDQAFRIKDDIVSHLQGNKGFQQGEFVARQLLENHIQTITSIVKKLSHDIEVLERQIKTRDDVTSGTSYAVQSLDHKHLQGVGDLRGRVARCDASIAKLSGDTNIIRHEIQKQEREIHAIQSTLENYSNNVEMKVMQLLGKIETANSDQNSHLKAVQGDQHHELQLLDLKINGLLNDLKDQIQNQRKWTECEVRRSEQEQIYLTNQLIGAMKGRLDAVEMKMEDGFHYFCNRTESIDKVQQFDTELSQVKNDQNKLHARISRFEKRMWNELEEMQSEYRSGFQSIRDSLDALKQIQTTKLKLEKEKFKQDMKKIRRKITELQDD
ncbi:protein FAM81B isoform X2 [Hemicordylus capensis]|nr:protein FAM81B isoform X2 [Hemicordylus capensis]XP_053151895.1 protein FAM81B isoform X2 [Hemicordylus capensis]XP_053151896.1 protein FAM81B isoform X2 [Hemicordylus capensis]XP_053151897.1 protein FAM81B isoform X2 [Hemicordylus capensis]XP_053151898.1 protein FAM81B isoform X2 [Hemicordylus capensis]